VIGSALLVALSPVASLNPSPGRLDRKLWWGVWGGCSGCLCRADTQSEWAGVFKLRGKHSYNYLRVWWGSGKKVPSLYILATRLLKSVNHSFMYSFRKYLTRSYSVSGTGLGTKDPAMNRKEACSLLSEKECFQGRKEVILQIIHNVVLGNNECPKEHNYGVDYRVTEMQF
jgi:hypothetical protein